MTTDDGQLTFEQPRSVFSTWFGIVLLFAFFGLLVWAVMGALPRGTDYEEKRAAARFEKLKTARAEWDPLLHQYGWVDKAKGTVHVPIDRAMELSVAELAQKKPAPANAIAPADLAAPGMQATAPAAPSPVPVATPPENSAALPPATALEGKDSANRGQPTGSSNPPNARPGTQPGPFNTPAASPPAGSDQPNPSGKPVATPVQSPPGTPLPVPGKTP